jgi:cysteine desulfurase/selenocysteine lyase
VIDAISKYYQEINANIHRGVYTLSQLATDAYEISRGKIQNHINAKFSHEVIYPGTTFELIGCKRIYLYFKTW